MTLFEDVLNKCDLSHNNCGKLIRWGSDYSFGIVLSATHVFDTNPGNLQAIKYPKNSFIEGSKYNSAKERIARLVYSLRCFDGWEHNIGWRDEHLARLIANGEAKSGKSERNVLLRLLPKDKMVFIKRPEADAALNNMIRSPDDYNRIISNEIIKIVKSKIQLSDNNSSGCYRHYLVNWKDGDKLRYGIRLSASHIFSYDGNHIGKPFIIAKSINDAHTVTDVAYVERDAIENRLLMAIIRFEGWNYNETSWNDEHFARLVTTGKALSYKTKEVKNNPDCFHHDYATTEFDSYHTNTLRNSEDYLCRLRDAGLTMVDASDSPSKPTNGVPKHPIGKLAHAVACITSTRKARCISSVAQISAGVLLLPIIGAPSAIIFGSGVNGAVYAFTKTTDEFDSEAHRKQSLIGGVTTLATLAVPGVGLVANMMRGAAGNIVAKLVEGFGKKNTKHILERVFYELPRTGIKGAITGGMASSAGKLIGRATFTATAKIANSSGLIKLQMTRLGVHVFTSGASGAAASTVGTLTTNFYEKKPIFDGAAQSAAVGFAIGVAVGASQDTATTKSTLQAWQRNNLFKKRIRAIRAEFLILQKDGAKFKVRKKYVSPEEAATALFEDGEKVKIKYRNGQSEKVSINKSYCEVPKQYEQCLRKLDQQVADIAKPCTALISSRNDNSNNHDDIKYITPLDLDIDKRVNHDNEPQRQHGSPVRGKTIALAKHSIYAPSVRSARPVGQVTFGEYFDIAFEVYQNGGDERAQVTAQQGPRPRL